MNTQPNVNFTAHLDPYVYQTLQAACGHVVTIETVRGNLRGVVADVAPDHVVLQIADSTFFIRIQQIVWVRPE
ncbi:YuzF family protein [Brevibacillus dissolubilis]|uniref:YuzF family protein n=1 Tax=Brevibacillus dissolubilis TaxID=1844116 RepID=UPI001116B162|nr:YuzF family protein [Brevibacillus dissolubilis]